MSIQDDPQTCPTQADSSEPADEQVLPRGTALGRYIIIEPLGAGGMGSVYRAYDPELNRGIALKILSVKQADIQLAQKAKTRLLREAQALVLHKLCGRPVETYRAPSSWHSLQRRCLEILPRSSQKNLMR